MSKINNLWGNIFRKTDSESDVISTLKGVPIFQGLGDRELKEIEGIVHKRHFKAGETIFWEGEPGMGMYIIQHGEVEIYSGKDTEHQEKLAHLYSGDFFGDMALLSEEPRSATAISTVDSQVFGLYRPDLFELFERKPEFAFNVLSRLADMLAQRLKKANEELQEFKSKTAS
jgi:CRP-like cAMP-binding protein